jgi:hypothetical protein
MTITVRSSYVWLPVLESMAVANATWPHLRHLGDNAVTKAVHQQHQTAFSPPTRVRNTVGSRKSVRNSRGFELIAGLMVGFRPTLRSTTGRKCRGFAERGEKWATSVD